MAALLFFVANLEVAIVDLLCEGKYAELMQAKPHTGYTHACVCICTHVRTHCVHTGRTW